jgi:hypothetical protein
VLIIFGTTELPEILTILTFIAVGGIVILIPGIIVTQIAFKLLARRSKSQVTLKLLFALFSITLIWLTVYGVDFPVFTNSNIIISTCYSLSVLLTSMLVKVQERKI